MSEHITDSAEPNRTQQGQPDKTEMCVLGLSETDNDELYSAAALELPIIEIQYCHE